MLGLKNLMIHSHLEKMMQQTFAMIKPDAISRGFSGIMLARIEAAHFRIIELHKRELSESFVKEFYKEHVAAPFFPGMIARIANQPIIAMVLEGKEAVVRFRQLIGATDPKNAATGTLRSDYGIDLDQNSVHGSDSVASAEREISLFFGKK